MNEAAMRELIAAVERGECCTIPSPRIPHTTVRVMAYADGWMMMRHKGCTPFAELTRVILADLRAHLSLPAEGGGGT